MTLHALEASDREAIAAAVEDFTRKAVAPLVDRHEIRLSNADLAALHRSALQAGILPCPEAPAFGLWEAATPASLSLTILRKIAQSSAGVSFRFHMHALAAAAARSLGISPEGCLLQLSGAAPLGKGAFSRYLHDSPAEDALLKESLVTPAQPLLGFAPGEWTFVVGPTWSNGSHWRRWAFETVTAKPVENPHGLEEAHPVVLSLTDGGEPLVTSDPLSVLLQLSAAHASACVAIALGAVDHAITMAAQYANERRQGGTLLREHAAIRLLLGEASANAASVSAMLSGMAPAAETAASFEETLRIRAVAHPLLCAAANNCLQVFGGYGYMQDYGLEKIVRDCNALRLVSGGTTDLLLHIGTGAALR